MQKILYLIFYLFLFISFVSASYNDCSIYGTCKVVSTSFGNITNNITSNYYNVTFNLTNTSYYLLSNPYSYYNSTTLPNLNSTGLIINWSNIISGTDWNSTGLIQNWNVSGWIRNQTIAETNWNSSGFIREWTSADWNSSGLLRDWNTTGYLRDWTQSETDPMWTANFTTSESAWLNTTNITYNNYNSTGLIMDWNVSGWIRDWNITGLIQNWSLIPIDETDALAYNGTLAYNQTLVDMWSPFLNTTNSSYLMIDRFNVTNTSYALNQTLTDVWTDILNGVDLNATGLVRDWNASGYIRNQTIPETNWNASGWISNQTGLETDWNSTGYLINWGLDTSLLNTTNLSYLTIDRFNTTNTSYLMIDNWNATNISYMLIDNWNSTNSSYALNQTLTDIWSDIINGANLNATSLVMDWNISGWIRNQTIAETNWNSTGLIIDWNVSGYIRNWTGIDFNATGLIINWSDIDFTNESYLKDYGDTSTGDYNFSGILYINSVNENDVGIGTNSPSEFVHIVRNLEGNTILRIDNFDTGVSTTGFQLNSENGIFTFLETNDNPAWNSDRYGMGATVMENTGPGGIKIASLYDDENASIKFSTGGNFITRMIIANNGNVGIGTIAPNNTLQVIGEINASQMLINNTNVMTTDLWNSTNESYLKDYGDEVDANYSFNTLNLTKGFAVYWNATGNNYKTLEYTSNSNGDGGTLQFKVNGTDVSSIGNAGGIYINSGVSSAVAPFQNWTTYRFGGASNKHWIGDTGTLAWWQTYHLLYIKATNGGVLPYNGIPDLAIGNNKVGIETEVANYTLDVFGELDASQITINGTNIMTINQWNSTNSTYNAYNSTGLIQNWNASGLIRDWSGGTETDPKWTANITGFYRLNATQIMGIINATHITAGTINSTHLLAGTINATHIMSLLNATMISFGTINGTHIVQASINATHLQVASINATRIAQVAVNSTHLSASSINASAITAGIINSSHISAEFNSTFRIFTNETFTNRANFTSNMNVSNNITLVQGGYNNCIVNRTLTAYICHNGTGWIIKG